MFSLTIVIAALSAQCAMSMSLGADPRHKRDATNSLMLQIAANRTSICPIVVDVEVKKGRIPESIKMIRCADHAFQECPANVPEEKCCYHKSRDSMRQCYQLEELVPAMYGASLKMIKVQVGCACMVQDIVEATEIS